MCLFFMICDDLSRLTAVALRCQVASSCIWYPKRHVNGGSRPQRNSKSSMNSKYLNWVYFLKFISTTFSSHSGGASIPSSE
jgi:hypothetical protein